MANLQVKDGAAATKYMKTDGVGTDGDPHVSHHVVDSGNITETNSGAIKTAVEGTLTANLAQVTGVVSTNNSTTAVLGAGATFTGVSDDVKNYKSIGVLVIASHTSAADGMSLQFSSDGTNWDKAHLFTLPAATAKFFNLPVEARYFRVVYTNGGTIQTYFRLQVIYHATNTMPSTLRLGTAIDAETAAELTRSVISGLDVSSGLFVNVNSYDTGPTNSLVVLPADTSANPIEVLTAGADNVVNTTNQLVTAGFGYWHDGTNWDMARGDATDGLLVNLGANNDVAVSSGSVNLLANDGVDIGDVDVASMPADTFVAEDGALGKGVLVQGDDGTDRHNLQTDVNGYLKTIAQANDGVDIGNVDVASIGALEQTTPTFYNLTLTVADTEYIQALPANTRALQFQCRTENDIRYAFETGKVATPTAPYSTLKAGDVWYKENIKSSGSLYAGSSTAGVIVEIETWS